MPDKHIAPERDLDAFHCPHCGVYAHQNWGEVLYDTGLQRVKVGELSASICSRCDEYALWIKDKMLYPLASIAPLPTEDMPDDVKADFLEARNIVNASPRSAAALLRLAIQKLMPHLGEKGRNLDNDIGSLVEKGLPEKIQQALDVVRVIGNNAVHPGEIDLKDDIETALRLFELVNLIVEVMITQPKKVGELYDKIPEGAKKAIEKRDGKV